MLTTTGKKSGRLRTVPLVGFRVDGRLVVIASNFGRSRHPSWYLNLRENPRARLTIDGVTSDVEARELAGMERDSCFEKGLELYPGYLKYGQRARRIPVISLEPPASESHSTGWERSTRRADRAANGHRNDLVGRLGDRGGADH